MTMPTTGVRPVTAQRFINFLQTGEADGVFAADVLCDFNFPYTHVQVVSAEAVTALRRSEHPGPTEVHVERLDVTERGWVLQFEEHWERGGESWYGRILLRADVDDDHIVGLAAYDTGDWDEARQRQQAGPVPAGPA